MFVTNIVVREQHKLPDFRAVRGRPFIFYGEQNDYPDYLIQLYSRSTIHNTIINAKVGFIFGEGLYVDTDDVKQRALFDMFLNNTNKTETLNDVLKKIIKDNEIFSGFDLKINQNPITGKPINIAHTDWTRLRTDQEVSTLWYSRNWTLQGSIRPLGSFINTFQLPLDAVQYSLFDWNRPQLCSMLYYRAYRPQMKVYPVPEYIGACAAIETQIEIDNYHLNNIKTGFSAGHVVVFYNGIPDPKQQVETEKMLKKKFTGTTNAGEIAVCFFDSKERGMEVINMRPTELADQFNQLSESNRSSIFIGHRITSPTIFGVVTPGALGQRDEMIDAYELFDRTYVSEKRKIFEDTFTDLFYLYGGSAQVKIKGKSPVSIKFSESTLEKILTVDEMREIIGKPKLVVGQKTFSQQKEDTILNCFDDIGEPSSGYEILFSRNLSNDDLSNLDLIEQECLVQHKSKNGFGVELSDDAQKVFDILKEDNKINIALLIKTTQLSEAKVLAALNELNTKNVIKANVIADGGKIEVVRSQINEPDSITLSTKYRYWGPKDSKNRPFCAEMLKKEKLYTRQEIDRLSNDQGTDVWKYKGGWYHDPSLDVNFPSCRHMWQVVIVKSK